MATDGFKARLNALYSEKKCSQQEIAYAVGTSSASVNRWLQGKATPRMDKITKLAAYFAVSPEWLMTGTEPPFPAPDEKTHPKPDSVAPKNGGWHPKVVGCDEHLNEEWVNKTVSKIIEDTIGFKIGISPDENELLMAYRQLTPVEKNAIRKATNVLAAKHRQRESGSQISLWSDDD